jgi:DNA replicative helicase MCM subunit Mcm2 (Cdc46/Mcm family)
MHNDLLRGSNVFASSSDTILQIRRSAADERIRIMKVTKGREISDKYIGCRLLTLNSETLWFKDEGETNEEDHIAKAIPTAEAEIDFTDILSIGEVVPRKKIMERCKPLGFNARTVDRQLKKAKENGTLIMPKFGYYELRHFDNPIQNDVNVKAA